MDGIVNTLLYLFLSLLGLSGDGGYDAGNKGMNHYVSGRQPIDISVNEAMVNRFYSLNHQQLYWFSLDKGAILRRQSFKNCLDSSSYLGLDKMKYHYREISEHTGDLYLPEDSLRSRQMDRIFTDAALMFGLDIYRGAEIGKWMNTDDISSSFYLQDESYIITQMLEAGKSGNMDLFLSSLEPRDSGYKSLSSALKNDIDSAGSPGYLFLISSINQFRWLHHFNFEKFVVVNIPSATLCYYEFDSVRLKMKVVLGKPSTRTPRFSAYCDQIILFPYWNVPHSIAVNEYLPMFKRMPGLVTSLNMQILDDHGNIIPEDNMNWSLYSKVYFPYRLRQSTGCDNALGVMKFNLTSPYDVYMHDTNMKPAFNSDYRFYSHGCIRLEKPFELANYMLDTPLDTNILNKGLKEQNPKSISLPRKIPVFIVYMCAEATGGQVKFYPDIYKLLK